MCFLEYTQSVLICIQSCSSYLKKSFFLCVKENGWKFVTRKQCWCWGRGGGSDDVPEPVKDCDLTAGEDSFLPRLHAVTETKVPFCFKHIHCKPHRQVTSGAVLPGCFIVNSQSIWCARYSKRSFHLHVCETGSQDSRTFVHKFLSACAKLRKTFYLRYVHLSTWNNSTPTGRILMKLDI